ncbi:hypothetical protein TNCV_5028071 [Trichonephila clavipes]|nr:hypothetical protein TNCV_5028071 [Trichonephila clavipes]
MDSETLGEVGTPLQLGDEIHFLACALPPYHNSGSLETRQNGVRARNSQKIFVSQLQEFYPYCIEDTAKNKSGKRRSGKFQKPLFCCFKHQLDCLQLHSKSTKVNKCFMYFSNIFLWKVNTPILEISSLTFWRN